MNSNNKRHKRYIAKRGTPLTAREAQVLALMGEGRHIKQIADALGLKDKTVRTYGDRIRDRLGATTLTHLGVLAERAGLLQSNPPEKSGNGLAPQRPDPASPRAAGGAA